MTERETTGAQTGLPGTGPEPRPAGGASWRGRLALVAGSTTALVTASLLGSALGFLNKAACRSGDWNILRLLFQKRIAPQISAAFLQNLARFVRT